MDIIIRLIFATFLMSALIARGQQASGRSGEQLEARVRQISLLPRPFSLPPLQVSYAGNNIGDTCSGSLDCGVIYSQCFRGTCQCLPGFSPNNVKTDCIPFKLGCPIGEPLLNEQGQPATCNSLRSPVHTFGTAISSVFWVDQCPGTHYCLKQTTPTGAGGHVRGSCCPKPNVVCPVGEPFIGSCPYDTHTTLAITLWGQSQANVCCPVPCSLPNFYYGGRCYSPRSSGQRCEIDEQCTQSSPPDSAVCKQGVCTCTENFLTLNDLCVLPYCSQNAAPLRDRSNQFLHCDIMSPVPGRRRPCPPGAYCNFQGTCCPIPDFICPEEFQTPSSTSGAPAKTRVTDSDRCSTRNVTSCERGEQCTYLYQTQDPDSNEAAFCCSAPAIKIAAFGCVRVPTPPNVRPGCRIETISKNGCPVDFKINCPPSQAQSANPVCGEPPETGPCQAFATKWFFDEVTGNCFPFLWGGCNGTRNRHNTLQDCRAACPAGAGKTQLQSPEKCPPAMVSSAIKRGLVELVQNSCTGDFALLERKCTPDTPCNPGEKCCFNGIGFWCTKALA